MSGPGNPGKDGTFDDLLDVLFRLISLEERKRMLTNLDNSLFSPMHATYAQSKYKVQDIRILQKVRNYLERTCKEAENSSSTES